MENRSGAPAGGEPTMRAAHCAIGGGTGHQAGRALLAKLYRMETGEPLPPILLTPRGKPYFADSPFHFSISHTPRHAFCVLARCPVGMDAEEVARPVRLSLAEKVLSPAEQARMAQAEDPRLAFLSMWVLKEAAAKRSGEGLRGYPNHTDFSPRDPALRRWADCVVAILGENGNEGVICYDF